MLHTEEDETCPTRGQVSGGFGNFHWAGLCEDCDVRVHTTGSLEKVEEMHREGRIGQDVYEAYTYVWSTATPRFSTLRDVRVPTDSAARRIARKMYRRVDLPIPEALMEANG